MKIILETSTGLFVHEQEAPPFNEPPEVIGWGDRVFKFYAQAKNPDGPIMYREVFAYALPVVLISTVGVEATHPSAQKEFTDAEIRENPILRFFHYSHLPPSLQARSKPFFDLARTVLDTTPINAERTAAFRKLLEAKDAGVRAALPPKPPEVK